MFSLSLKQGIYDPAEDSELLIRAVESMSPVKLSLDVGTGSGIVALYLSKKSDVVVATDINRNAILCARENARRNGADNILFTVGDLTRHLKKKFDVITFNPPYLPIGNNLKPEENPELAWDGGKTGREVIERFLREAGDVCHKKTRIFLVISSLTGLAEVLADARDCGFLPYVRREEKVAFETLYLLELLHH